MEFGGLFFEPYSEPGDPFIERFEDFTSRLHINRLTGHMRFEPMPDARVLDNFYNGSFTRSDFSPSPKTEFTPAIVEVCRGVLDYIASVAGIGGAFTLHDVGCGFGGGVWGWQQLGVVATGNEANRSWIEQANPHVGGALHAGPLLEVLTALGYPIDVFFISHVLEHLSDPLTVLREMASNMSDSGVIYINVPNGWCQRVKQEGRRTGIDYGNFPMHLNFFTPRSMQVLLAEAGLEAVQIETRPFDELPHRTADPDLRTNVLSNLGGGELFVLAAKPLNTGVGRQPDLDALIQRAQEAFASE